MKTAQESRAQAQDNHKNATKSCYNSLLVKELNFISDSIDLSVENGLMSYDYSCLRYLDYPNIEIANKDQYEFERNLVECLNSYGYKCEVSSFGDYLLKISWI